MVTSKFRNEAYVILWVGLVFFVGTLGSIIWYAIDKFYFSDSASIKHATTMLTILSYCIFLFLLAVWLRSSAKTIKIDSTHKTIAFTNIFTRTKEVYRFDDFDGYFDTIVKGGHGTEYKAYYIIKDKKAIGQIISYYYSNMNELEESLKSLTYLGFKKFGQVQMFRILLNQPVL